MKRKIILCVCLILAILIISPLALAHPGGLDSSGGHKDKKNVSGLGGYHYHCGDHPPHLHGPSGLCPFSKEYKEYKEILDELKIYVDKVDTDIEKKQASVVLTEEEVERIQTLLLHKLIPFKLTEELLAKDSTLYGQSNIKGLNVRKKQSTSSEKVCAIPLSGSVLQITQDKGDGWYSIMVFVNNKNYTGYVKSDMVDLIDKPEYLIGLSKIL